MALLSLIVALTRRCWFMLQLLGVAQMRYVQSINQGFIESDETMGKRMYIRVEQ